MATMNVYQKRILIAVIALISGMFLYPPFQDVAQNGGVRNMGYRWIFSPPWTGRGHASINVAFLFVQWIGVALVGGLGFFLAKDINLPAQSIQKEEPKGVRGWLLVLVVGMMVLGPLLGTMRIAVATGIPEFDNPALKAVEAWETYKTGMWLAFLVAAALSFYGGWGLLRGKDRAVVARAQTILWICGPGLSLVLNVLVPMMTLGETGTDGSFVGIFIGNVISAVIWTAYLSKSKRVHNTYGEPGAGAAVSTQVSHRPPTAPPVSSFQQPVTQSRQSTPAKQAGFAPATSTESKSVQPVPAATPFVVDEDAIYATVAAELESGNIDKGLWTRLYAECDGDERKQRVRYIQIRAERLRNVDICPSDAAPSIPPAQQDCSMNQPTSFPESVPLDVAVADCASDWQKALLQECYDALLAAGYKLDTDFRGNFVVRTPDAQVVKLKDRQALNQYLARTLQ